MTEILFYHLQGQKLEGVLTPLLEKSLERGWKVAVQGASEERIDALVWPSHPSAGASGESSPPPRPGAGRGASG